MNPTLRPWLIGAIIALAIALGVVVTAIIVNLNSEPTQARAVAEQALKETPTDTASPVIASTALIDEGVAAFDTGDIDTARELLTQAVDEYAAAGDTAGEQLAKEHLAHVEYVAERWPADEEPTFTPVEE